MYDEWIAGGSGTPRREIIILNCLAVLGCLYEQSRNLYKVQGVLHGRIYKNDQSMCREGQGE